MSLPSRTRVGVDTGGTFTDLLLLRDGRLQALKVPSTPDDPSRAVLDGLRRLGVEAGELVHGTTVGTNALLQRRGARTALITNRGFRDLLEIGRQARPRLYELEPRRPDPLVPRELRREVDGRLLPGGEEEQALDSSQAKALGEELRGQGVESIAVVLLHSYANPEHERQVEEALRPAGLPVSCSYEVLREYREYERTVATVLNAYLRPVMEGYLTRLDSMTGGCLRVMRSNGGSLSASGASRLPVQTLLSGPAGGVVGAGFLGKLAGEDRILSFDMGGTSTDVSLLQGGPCLTGDATVAGLPLRVPTLDIHTVGAGGGSIAWRDAGGALRVGPGSAGADPGPACYGRGDEPTVTDAHVLLGRLPADGFLGGEMVLQPERSAAALGRLATGLHTTPERLALGVVDVARASMERALRVISLERGHDPARFVLYCFGGAGGLHAVELARGLGIPRVRVPAQPGLFSALGMLASDVAVDASETLLLPWSDLVLQAMEPAFLRMEEETGRTLEAEGFPEGERTFERRVDLRYQGQSFEIGVPFGSCMPEEFHQAHERLRGHSNPARPLQVVNLRVRAVGRVEPPTLEPLRSGPADPAPACTGARSARLDEAREEKVPVYRRDRMTAGMRLAGPAIVTDYSSTVWLPEGARLEVDRWGSLMVETG